MSEAAVSSRWQCCVSLQSFLSRTELLSAARCPKTHDCCAEDPSHISLLLPHKFCSTFLSFFSVPLQPEYIAALSDTMLRLGLEWRRHFFFTFLWEWKGSTDTSSLPAISPFSCLPPLLVSVMVQLRLRIWKWNLEGRAHIKPATQLHSAHRYKHADSLTNTSDTA